ncbi:hypothetical protein E4T39_06235 [Aureobasidium subglaciale]|nr:hypothetical protein E4T39_06235 [Aureobasidium subglaciale]
MPFRSSRLALPPSPFTPSLPAITPHPQHFKRTCSATAAVDLMKQLPPPSRQPQQWLWSCHLCGRHYNLGVTRRCLDDGHYFCAGTSMVKSRKDNVKRLRKHRACASEFDYAGWKDWGVWKRGLIALTEQQRQLAKSRDSVFDGDESEDEVLEEITAEASRRASSWRVGKPILPLRPVKDCWNRCDYPSDCRWGKQFGVDTPLQASFSVQGCVSSSGGHKHATPEHFEFEDVDLSTAKTHFKDILTAEQQQVAAEALDGVDVEATPLTSTATPALADLTNLVLRAQRRHSRIEIPASPLAPSQLGARPRVTRTSSRESLRRAVEGGIGAIAGFMGGWRSYSAPPVTRRKEEQEEVETLDIADEHVQKKTRRKSFG